MTMLQSEANFTNTNPPPVIGPAKGRQRIEELIAKGRNKALSVIDHVSKLQPTDRIVKVEKLSFELEDHVIQVTIPGKEDITETVHHNALQQASEKAGIPWKFAGMLQARGDWGIELLASNLNELLGHNKDRALTRSVNGQMRGFLSDRYKRLDSRPLVDSFAKSCAAVGALPYEGYVTDTKVGLQAIIPRVYEPIPNEIMAYGVNFENSDFGNGALDISFFMLRLVCLNGMIGESSLRKVHLGRRLDDDLDYSKKTHELDQKTIVSAVGDMVRGQLGEGRIDKMQAFIKASFDNKLDDKKRESTMEVLKQYLNKGEVDKMMKKFNEPDVELLPPGNNMWRMSNALSWLAGEQEDAERTLEMQRLAGKLLVQ